MSEPLSSTTSLEARSSRGSIVAGSTGPEPIASRLSIVPVSTKTLRTMRTDIQVSLPENLRAALEKYLADADATAGMVTCRFTEGKGTSWTFESPTLRLNAEAFQPSAEWLTGEQTFSRYGVSAPAAMTVRVVGLGAAAQSIVPAPGLLNSTDRSQGASRLVESKFAEAVALAGEEWFEDGVESDFSRTLSTLLHTYRDAAIAPVETFLGSPSTNIEVAVEAAQWLGKVDHPASRRYRRSLLEKVLSSAPSARLRHGAAAGLADMDDPSSLSAVVEARDRESNRRLRHFLQLVVDQLERTRACLST